MKKSQNRVLVLDRNQEALMPCHPARARRLLREKQAFVVKHYPFTIQLKSREGGELQPIECKLDPGSTTTGIAIVVECKRGKRCVWATELTHRGKQVKAGLHSRRGVRRGRRYRKTRYRKPRFKNRRRPKGWLPPSLRSRVDNVETWLRRLMRFAPVTALAMELTRFDTQAMENPEMSGVKYQQGELQGFEVREYLLDKFGRQCVYCKKKGVPLQVEHIVPKSRGGSNRVSNLTVACEKCNQRKGNKTAEEFGHPEVQALAKKPLKGAAVMNATRFAILDVLKATGLPVSCGTGGQTKYNRTRQGYPKTHWLDAVCVGESGGDVYVDPKMQILEIKAMGRGTRQVRNVDGNGFPVGKAKKAKKVRGFMTGDMCVAVFPKGKYKGKHVGRVSVRAKGSFVLRTKGKLKPEGSWKHFRRLQCADGYQNL